MLLLFSCPVVSDSLRPHGLPYDRPLCPSPSPEVLPKFMSIESVMPTNHLILCHALLFLPSIIPSISIPSNEFALFIRQPMDWSFSFNIGPSKEYSELIPLRIDWFDLLVIQETLKSLLQYHGSKASILRHSAFFMVQHSHAYMTTGKNHSFNQTDLCQQSNVSAF